jgi:hypothetical protein
LFESDDILDPCLGRLDGGEDIRMRFELAKLFLVLFESDDILDPRLGRLDGGEDIRMRFELALALAAKDSVKLPDAAIVQAHERSAPVPLE